MKKFLFLMTLAACSKSDADVCRELIFKVCKAKMAEEIPADVIESQGGQMLENCTTYVWSLKTGAEVSDAQCVKDMTRVMDSYQVP